MENVDAAGEKPVRAPCGRPRSRSLAAGARVAAIEVAIGKQKRNVALGFPSLAEYIADRAAMGAICGRYANRIAGGKFTLDNQTYALLGWI